MINTDKYEGHSTKWMLDYNDWTWAESMFTAVGETNEADALLIEDAPLLLEEVKRLQKRNEWLEEVVAQAQEHYHIDLSDEGWPRWGEE